MGDPIQLKEEGNKHFQAGDIDKAIECYTKAIKVCQDKKVLAVIYRNRSACYLKKENYANAASDATKAIDVDAKDIKALYRRCQALEKLGKLDMAFKDVQRCATLEPKNKAFLETLRRLGAEIQSKLKTSFSTDSRVQNMFDILFDEESEKDKKEKAANNLIVLSREDAGAERIFQNNGVTLLLNMIETGKPEMILAAVRTLSGMCTGHKARAMAIIQMVGIDKMCSIMALDNEEIALAACNLFQCINDSLTGGDTREYGKEADLVMDPSKDLKTILLSLLEMVASKKVSGHGRDQALNLLSKNVPRKEKKEMDHSKSLFTIDHGLKKILKVCGQVPELPDQLPLTENTQLIASVLLNKLYDDLKCDPERNNFRDICDEYIKSKIDPKDMDKTIHAINCISGLLQGPFDVGNALVGRQGIMEMMVALCGSEREVDQMVAYAVACILVNCTNSYEKKEILPELVQLAKFSKQHVPEQHPKDKKDFVDKRVKRLLKAGVTSALAVMVKAENIILTDQTKEMLARVFLALSEDPRDRGTIVAQGGGKALIPLALEGTEAGKVKASHVIAKIAAISNPEIAFPGERVYEVIRPLVNLLHTDREGMQNYEALRGLTNLAGFSEKLRVKIVKEKALPEIENYMFEENEQIRLAATECMCNLVTCKEVQDRYLDDGNDKLKLLVLLCGEDDDKLQIAAGGALAMITAAQKKLCTKMTLVTSQWLEILQRLCLHSNVQVQHRGLVIVYNMLNSDNSDLAKKLIESELLEILSVVGRAEDNPKRQEAIDAARTCLVKAMDLGLIKPFASPS
ncbi:protein unc-45 homolog B [Neolamprologus brichardi]|uniref:protein unc-45 homolog B n=1 Tax=Neolamprologus brichardi TaxID=32507 RepID=UPI001643B9F2|nr:protein unc-45 homolog B [Neolamprologus brichardi]